MIKRTLFISSIILILVAIFTVVGFFYFNKTKTIKAQESAIHPRLLFTENEIPALKTKINDRVGEDDAAFDKVINYANNIINYSSDSSVLGQSYGIHNIPMLAISYYLSDDSNPNKYTYRDKCKDALIYMANNYDHTGSPHYASMRLHTLSLGFDLCFDSATSEERETMVNEIYGYLSYAVSPYRFDWYKNLYRPYTNNGGILAASAVGLGSIVMRGETEDTQLLDDSLQYSEDVLSINLESTFGEDGAYTEEVLYIGFAMRFLCPYIEARLKYDGYDYGQLPQVKNIINWLAYGLRPSFWSPINNLNDSLRYTFPLSLYNTVFDWAQMRYQSGLAKWLWLKEAPPGQGFWESVVDNVATVLWGQNIQAADPDDVLPKAELFPHRGLYYYRTGWPSASQSETDDSVFSFYSGKFWGGHAHSDQGQFTLFSKGENFITDTGYGVTSSKGHNLVFIDNAGQHYAGSSIGTDGNIVHHLVNSPFADYIHSDNEAAYDTYSEFNAPGYPFPDSDWSWGYVGANPVEKADRYVLAVKKSEVGEYFVIFDDIDKDGLTHKYDWTMHTDFYNTIDTSNDPVTITGDNKGNKLDLYFVNPDFSNLSFSQSTFTVNNLDGDTKRILATYSNVVNPEFFTIMFPKKAISIDPTFSFEKLNFTNGKGAKLTWNNGVNDYILYKDPSHISSIFTQGINTDGRFTLVRKNSESLTKFSLFEGTSLLADGTSIAKVFGGSASISSDGETITVSNPSYVYFIYGPMVTRVVDNEGNSLSFGTAGDYVYINYPNPDDIPPATIDDLTAQ